MLSQFSVKNFLSFKDQATLSMEAVRISEHKETLIKARNGAEFLPLAVIYGPNGGGKSNMLMAISALADLVMSPIEQSLRYESARTSRRPGRIAPFALCPENAKLPTEFEVFFCTETAEYRYRLHVKDSAVSYESIDRIKFSTGRVSSLLERVGQAVRLTGDFRGLKVPENMAESLPALAFLGIAYAKNAVVSNMIGGFFKTVSVINPAFDAEAFFADEKLKGLFLRQLQAFDMDIADARMEKRGDGKAVFFAARQVGGVRHEFSLAEESAGTQQLFAILPAIITRLLHGGIVVADDLGRGLHPTVLRSLAELFKSPSSNPNGAQLIFTTHDVSIMDGDVFRRDEIWFAAKGQRQDSAIYSLAEFKQPDGKQTRKDAKYSKQYLEGKYGALPFTQQV